MTRGRNLTLRGVLGLAIGLLAIFTFLARTAQPLFKGLQERLAVLNTRTQENLSGVEVVKAFVREPHEIERFEAANEAFTR